MNKKTLIFPFFTSIGIWFLVFIASTQILGIPLWWVGRNLVPLSGIPYPESKFDVTINPEAPMTIGDSVMVIVRNASDKMPVENAKISVNKDGDHIHDYYSNSSGQARITYVGEVTVIKVSKTDFKTLVEAIPHSPAKWVRDEYWSMGIGIISGIVGSVSTYMLQKRRKDETAMKSISTTLTLWILGFPFLLISALFVMVFFLYRTSLDASVFLDTISTLFSAVLVNLLVWERLRDSLSKKLEYLHKNYLLNLYLTFKLTKYEISPEQVKRMRPDLERYGKFMGMSLYPKELLKQIDEFLISQSEFDSSLQKFDEIAEKYGFSSNNIRLDKRLLYHFTGIKPLEDFGTIAQTSILEWHSRIQLIQKEQSQLIEEISGLSEKTEKVRKQIAEKLEDFLKSNSLRLEPEQVSYPLPL